MTDYISRQAAIEALAGWKISPIVLGPVPTADVRENVKGIWEIDVAGQTAKCDQCHFLVYDFQARAYAFCPNCGADMKSETELYKVNVEGK